MPISRASQQVAEARWQGISTVRGLFQAVFPEP